MRRPTGRICDSAGRHLINQFLDELDGVGKNNDGILILAATNAPQDSSDPAFGVPVVSTASFLCRHLTTCARKSILEIKLRGKPVGNINLNKLVERTKEFSGRIWRPSWTLLLNQSWKRA
ncbi:MAG: hypothetical protein R2788_05580 [Saprospiraceae bacterium]